jgi:aerobic-type carbon monoxide dehydrogenase small subunit (CoxS/CutS family)
MAEMADPNVTEDTAKAVSRRRFIRGVIAGGAAVSSAGYLFRASTLVGQAPVAGASERLITLNINGQLRHADVMKQETLAWTLRYKLGLTGTKLGCDRSECGACTVLIDDVPHYSCSMLTHTVRNRKVTTVEGLAAADGTLHPVQQGVVDEQGFQCAFCMSGFIMATVGFLKINPNPTREELAHGISGNLCRCQDYDKILTSLMRGAEHDARRANERVSTEFIQADRQELFHPRPVREGHGTIEVRRRLPRRRHAVLQTVSESGAARAGAAHRRARSARHAGRESDSDGGRSARSGRQPHRQRYGHQGQQVGRAGLTMEPLYQGEPILAVAAVDEITAAEAIERIHIDFEPLPSWSIRSIRCGRAGRIRERTATSGVHRQGGHSARGNGTEVDRGGLRGGEARPAADGQNAG